jgi:hypothetical protein
VYLVSAIESIYNKNYNCNACLSEHEDEIITERKRAIKQCFSVRDNPLYSKSVFRFYKCIGNYSTEWAFTIVDMFMRYDKFGTLPFEGSIGDQPYKVIQLFNIVESLREAKREESNKSNTDSRVEQKILAKRARDGQRSTN